MNNELIQQLIAALTALMSLVTGFMADIPQMKDDIASLQGQIDSVEQVESAIGGDTFNFVAGGVYSLSGSGVGLTDTSITLDSFQMPVSGIELTMTDFGDIGYATIEPGKSKKEFISFTGISQNGSNDQATFTGVTRGLNFVAPYTASTTLRQTHSGGAKLVISNPPQLYNKLTAKDNDETITGLWHFNTVIPTFSGAADATSTLQAATRAYVNSVATQGAATSTESVGGLVELATQAEMASSTDLGLDRPLVPYTKYSTSTCTGTGFTFLVTKSDGNISNNCLDTAETIHWLGAFTLSSTTMGRLNASTTITHGTTTTQTFLMASSGGLGKVLTSNSTGVGTWQASVNRQFYECWESESAVVVNATSTGSGVGWGAGLEENGGEKCYFNFMLPPGKSITRFHLWAQNDDNTPGTGNVVTRISFMPITTGAQWGTADDSGDETFGLAASKNMEVDAIASTTFNGITAGRPYQVELWRKGGDAGDTLAAPWQVLGFDIQYE